MRGEGDNISVNTTKLSERVAKDVPRGQDVGACKRLIGRDGGRNVVNL